MHKFFWGAKLKTLESRGQISAASTLCKLFLNRVKCPVLVHDASGRPLGTKKSSCVRSRIAANLYDKWKLRETSTATLLKRTEWNNNANKKLLLVENFLAPKQLFTFNRLQFFICIVNLSCLFQQCFCTLSY